MSKTTFNAKVTELSLEELESVSGGVELTVLSHERTHAGTNDRPPTNHWALLARFYGL